MSEAYEKAKKELDELEAARHARERKAAKKEQRSALDKAFDDVPEPQRSAFLKEHETWFPPEDPKRQEHEGRATHVLRCQDEERNRQTLLKQRVVRDYQKSLEPTPAEKMIHVWNEDAKANLEKKAIKEKADAEIAEAKKAAQKKIEAVEKLREGGTRGRGTPLMDSQDT